MENDDIIVTELENGEFNGLDIFEIQEIPDISILIKDANEEKTFVKKHKKEFETMLTEFFLECKQDFKNEYQNQDYSIELLLKSEKVEQQIYKACVKLYIVIRGINSNKQYLINRLSALKKIVMTSLTESKYGVKDIKEKVNVVEDIKQVLSQEKRVLTKDFKIDNLQSRYMINCFNFDLFTSNRENFTKNIIALMEYPNSAIVVDLIPTTLTQSEINNVEQYSNILDNLKKGVQGVQASIEANVLAEKPFKTYSYYENNKNGVLYTYNIYVCASEQDIGTITTRLGSELSIGREKEYTNLRTIKINKNELDTPTFFCTLPWVINEIILDKNKQDIVYRTSEVGRLTTIVTAEEASKFFRVPYGDNTLSAGVNISKSDKGLKKYNKNVINNGDIMVGTLRSSNSGAQIGFYLKDLTKHMLVVGSPGCGKSTFSVGILDRLWKVHHVPFLVVEPAKNEYRAMLDSIEDLQVFTPGKDFISPYLINPFIPPKNVKLQSYKTVLKTAFSAAVTMESPIDKVFEEALDECYSRFGWMSHYTVDDGGEIFTMEDFVKVFRELFKKLGYDEETNDIVREGYLKFKGLARLFGSYNTIPIEDLLSKPTVIELAAIENEDQKSLIIALLFLSIQSYVNGNYIGTGEIKNVLLLEEAHVLLTAGDDKARGEANPSAVAKKMLIRMLAELRSLGISIIIADQSPEKVSTDIIRLINIKIGYNLVDKNDRRIFGDSADMKEAQIDRMTKLRPRRSIFLYEWTRRTGRSHDSQL